MTKIEQQVMASIGLIYAVRTLTSRVALKLYVLVLSLGGVVALVSVSDVFANTANVVAQGGVGSVVWYILAAILGTKLFVQIALGAGLVAFVSLIAPFFRVFAGRRVLA